jgi:hypothetical protein
VFRGLIYLITCGCFRKQKKELASVSVYTTSPSRILKNSSKKKVESQQTTQKTQEVVSETISSPSKKNPRTVILSATIIPDPIEKKDKDNGIGKVQTSKPTLPLAEREDGFGENITEEDSDKEDGKASLIGTYSDGKFNYSN